MQDNDEPSPIKELLYSELEKIGETSLRQQIQTNPEKLIRSILDESLPNLRKIQGSAEEIYCGFAEGLLHYILTNALIPSQRKINAKGVEVDIVIPDVRTLFSAPQNAIIIQFAKQRTIPDEQMDGIKRIQPSTENVWIVAMEGQKPGYKTYEVAGTSSLAGLIDDIKEFLSKRPQSKFKIFKVGS